MLKSENSTVRAAGNAAINKFWKTLDDSWLDMIRLNLFQRSDLKTARVGEVYKTWRIANLRKWFDGA